ncbi:lytic murein transglycosylase [Desulfonema magnum]|uniref:lytic murein transglycosylase n=1 Tax=Desulfonema magnum TaxID=45655 RepID=UPI001FE305D6|nr:lytic murein transglycosylase [Desulfonema magnum]
MAASADNKNDYYFKSLQAKLISDGFDKARIKKLYSEPRVSFNTKGVSSYFVHSESKLNYGQFLKKSPIRKARRYMKIHKTDLTAAEKAYGVNRRIITAIMLVETRLGTYTGKSSVFNILSTMAALESPKVKAILWKKISNSTHLTNEDFEKKAEKKSGWAYDELKAFLKYTAGEKINPLDIYGSYAGAMGICQFMPSNILTLARDGNNDGRINLFNHADAIMSIASYLNYYGWYPGIDSKKAYEVVYEYNHSQYYVNTILKIAELLKGQS